MTQGVLLFVMGRQRAGKDTTADYLVNYYGFHKLSLAAPVYGVARDLFGMVGKNRGLLIQVGVKMREIDPLVFPKKLWQQALALGEKPSTEDALTLPAGVRIVVPDVRFSNEWRFFKDRGGFAVRVRAAQEVRAGRAGYNPEFENDQTEIGIDDAPADVAITNESTFGALHDAIDDFATGIMGLKRQC